MAHMNLYHVMLEEKKREKQKLVEEESLKLSQMSLEIEEIFKDKNVIILGPASCLLEDFKNIDISSYDVVVSSSNHYPEQMKILGIEHIDVIFHSFDPDEFDHEDCQFWSDNETTIISRNYLRNHATRDRISKRSQGIEFDLLHQDPKLYLDKYTRLMGCNPSTGLLGVFQILDSQPKKLTIIGFDFYQSLYFYTDERYKDKEGNENFLKRVQNGEIGNHFPNKQLEFFKEYIKDYPNCELVGKLKQMCDE